MNKQGGKYMKRRQICAIAATLGLILAGLPVFAEDTDDSASVPIERTLTYPSDGGVHPADTAFTYTVSPVTSQADPSTAGTAQADTVFNGPVGGLTADGKDTVSDTNPSLYTGAGLRANVSAFSPYGPGIYEYSLTENQTDTAGVKRDSTVYLVDVFVTEDAAGTLQIAGIEAFREGASATGAKSRSIDFSGPYETEHVTLTKKIEGNQAETGRKFPFTCTLTGEPGKTYTYQIGSGAYTAVVNAKGTTTIEGNITLGDNETLTVYGLTENDTYTFTETEADGYRQTYAVNGGRQTEAVRGATGTETMGTTDQSVIYTNTKAGLVPTGILSGATSWLVISGAVVVFGVFFLRKWRTQ